MDSSDSFLTEFDKALLLACLFTCGLLTCTVSLLVTARRACRQRVRDPLDETELLAS